MYVLQGEYLAAPPWTGFHEASHGSFTTLSLLHLAHRMLGEYISLRWIVQPFDVYRRHYAREPPKYQEDGG